MEIALLPRKFHKLWRACVPLLKKGRPDDLEHARKTVEFLLKYDGKIKINKNILVPVAMMHDIGHSAILPEHFKYITGPKKLKNSKLVHMLAGAKIAAELLKKIKYPKDKTKEIVEIISIHDIEQLDLDIDWRTVYNTHNKKVFHDVDLLDIFNPGRLKEQLRTWPRDKLIIVLETRLNNFFFKEFQKVAIERIKNLKNLKLKALTTSQVSV